MKLPRLWNTSDRLTFGPLNFKMKRKFRALPKEANGGTSAAIKQRELQRTAIIML